MHIIPSVDQDSLAKLRQQLRAKLSALEAMLTPAFEREPLFPGSVHTSKHRCGKSWCHCADGHSLHEAVRLQIRFHDGLTNRAGAPQEAVCGKPRTEADRRLRKAAQAVRKWQKEVSQLLERIERARRSLEGLSEEDRKRPLR